jgi:hypothetical protein
VFAAWFVLASAVSLGAQPSGPAHAPDGRAPQLIAPLIFPARPGAPFMAIAKTTWVRTLPDGSTVTVHNERVVARDADGRVYEERRTFVPVDSDRQTRVTAEDFIDPAARTLTRCFPGPNYCEIYDHRTPPAAVTANPGLQPDRMTYIAREDLGADSFDNVEVQHSRDTTTMSAGDVGNSKTIVRSVEYWYAPSLGINLQVKRHDPRDGDQTLWLSDLSPTAPAPETFQPPQGYRMIDLRGTGAVPGPVNNRWSPPARQPAMQ